jgi:FkbH-like protein
MSFLEAHKIVAGFKGGTPLPFLLGISGTLDKLDVFLRASAAKRGRSVAVRTLPFNTLGQSLLAAQRTGETEVFLLFPWDLVPEADWRSGLPRSACDASELRVSAEATLRRLAKRSGARLLYVPAPIPPLFSDPAAGKALEAWLTASACQLGAQLLPSDTFSLGSYLANGSPFAGTRLAPVADAIVAAAIGDSVQPCKVLVTDLDNVLWGGIIGEDGLENIRYAPEGAGYRHFLYQSFLLKLKREGALLAAVSRNDPELANAPFASGRMTMRADDFIIIAASYSAKSALILQIARQLNLGVDSFVFVDDNPIEIQEVSAAVPGIRTMSFPANDDGLPEFFGNLAALFPQTVTTSEDAERTEMYRRRLGGLVPDTTKGADLTDFLMGLEMSLAIHDRTHGDRTRAVQLINKTNQFNLNGRRVVDEEVEVLLRGEGRLYTATLADRTGSHGEILACLIDANGVVRSFVMSCRVFQRRVEYAVFAWLAVQRDPPRALEFVATPRNEPIQQFLRDPAFHPRSDNLIGVDCAAFAEAHEDDLKLFSLGERQAAGTGTSS